MEKIITKFINSSRILRFFLFPLYKLKKIIRERDKKKLKEYTRNILSGNLIVTIDNIPGKYQIDIRSDILKRILLEKEYEPEIVALIKKQLQFKKDAINIGANIGLFTNVLANNIYPEGRVLSIEPTPLAFRYLKKNIKLNKNENKVILFNGIASSQKGIYKINYIEGKEEYSSLGNLIHKSVSNQKVNETEVPGNTIDELVNKHALQPGILVMDVEGAEHEVLLGAIETIKKYRPLIITEIDNNLLLEQDSSSEKLISFLNQMKYQVFNEHEKQITFKSVGNILAIPI